jgi:hypothetical protein
MPPFGWTKAKAAAAKAAREQAPVAAHGPSVTSTAAAHAAHVPGQPDSDPEVDDHIASTPDDMRAAANSIMKSNIPVLSEPKYLGEFDRLMEYLQQKKLIRVSGTILMAFYKSLKQDYSPNSLKTMMHCLKTVLSSRVDSFNFSRDDPCWEFISKSIAQDLKVYAVKSAPSVDASNIKKFVEESDASLTIKIAVLCAYMSGMRCNELYNLQFSACSFLPNGDCPAWLLLRRRPAGACRRRRPWLLLRRPAWLLLRRPAAAWLLLPRSAGACRRRRPWLLLRAPPALKNLVLKCLVET